MRWPGKRARASEHSQASVSTHRGGDDILEGPAETQFFKVKCKESKAVPSGMMPKRLKLSRKRLKRLRPSVAGVVMDAERYVSRLDSVVEGKYVSSWKELVRKALRSGEYNPGLVLSDTVVACYSKTCDAVVLLQLPPGALKKFGMTDQLPRKLLVSNLPCRFRYWEEPDFELGRRAAEFIQDQDDVNFHPFLAEMLTDDAAAVQAHKDYISTDDWDRLEELALVAFSSKPRHLRNGLPGLSQCPKCENLTRSIFFD